MTEHNVRIFGYVRKSDVEGDIPEDGVTLFISDIKPFDDWIPIYTDQLAKIANGKIT